MRRTPFYLIAIILIGFFKCTPFYRQEISGYYKHIFHGKNVYQADVIYSLKLNHDSSFILSIKSFEVNSSCQGRWRLSQKDTLICKCNAEPLISQLSSGYMEEREPKFVLLGNNRLLWKNDTLEKAVTRPN